MYSSSFYICNVILQIFIHTCGNPKRNEWKSVLNGLRELKIDTEFKPNLIHKYLKLTNLFKVGYPHDAHEAFLHIIDFLDDTSFKGNILHKIVTKGVPLEVNKNKGKASLRKKMWENALKKGNPNMMVWLSKNELNMRDKVETQNITEPLPLIIEAEKVDG